MAEWPNLIFSVEHYCSLQTSSLWDDIIKRMWYQSTCEWMWIIISHTMGKSRIWDNRENQQGWGEVRVTSIISLLICEWRIDTIARCNVWRVSNKSKLLSTKRPSILKEITAPLYLDIFVNLTTAKKFFYFILDLTHTKKQSTCSAAYQNWSERNRIY